MSETTAKGRAASKGEVTGYLVTPSMDAIDEVRKLHGADATLVLFATMTTPDDVPVMAECDGLVSATGGITCHTAVIAREWELPGIVGVTDLTVGEGYVRSGESERFTTGHLVTVNGGAGTVTFH